MEGTGENKPVCGYRLTTDRNFRVPEKYAREILPILFHLHLHLTYSPGFFSEINYTYSAQDAEDIFSKFSEWMYFLDKKKLFCGLFNHYRWTIWSIEFMPTVCMHRKTRLMPPDDSLSKELRISCIAKSRTTSYNYNQLPWSRNENGQVQGQGRGALSFPATGNNKLISSLRRILYSSTFYLNNFSTRQPHRFLLCKRRATLTLRSWEIQLNTFQLEQNVRLLTKVCQNKQRLE